MSLGARENLVDGEQPFEVGLGDPRFLIDALALDHRDLRCRPAPGEAAELEEADEDRAEGFGALDLLGVDFHGGDCAPSGTPVLAVAPPARRQHHLMERRVQFPAPRKSFWSDLIAVRAQASSGGSPPDVDRAAAHLVYRDGSKIPIEVDLDILGEVSTILGAAGYARGRDESFRSRDLDMKSHGCDPARSELGLNRKHSSGWSKVFGTGRRTGLPSAGTSRSPCSCVRFHHSSKMWVAETGQRRWCPAWRIHGNTFKRLQEGRIGVNIVSSQFSDSSWWALSPSSGRLLQDRSVGASERRQAPCVTVNRPYEDGSTRVYLGDAVGDKACCVLPDPAEQEGAFCAYCKRVLHLTPDPAAR